MDGPDGVEPVESVLFAPVHEPRDGPVVGLAGVGVADGDGEEVDESPRRAVVGRGDHGREPVCEFGERACRCALDELLGHGLS